MQCMKSPLTILLLIFLFASLSVPTEIRSNPLFPAEFSHDSGVWPVENQWDEVWENRFSNWISHLFRPLPNQKNKGWYPLHQVLHNPIRNSLHNALGLKEDDPSAPNHVIAIADCGDTPFQLRAYFAWKHRLPFRFRQCSRGNARTGPKCPKSIDNLTAQFDHIPHPVNRFNAFLKKSIGWRAHSGTFRTIPEDRDSDVVPIPLNPSYIKPGTVFVDVGGHVFVVTQWDEAGLYAIDGHPDKTVTRKRFSRDHFPYARNVRTGGFKAFRSVILQNGSIVPIPNEKLHFPTSDEQYDFSTADDFFTYMDTMIKENSPSTTLPNPMQNPDTVDNTQQ